MLARAVDYVVRRGINDAYALADISALDNQWVRTAEAITRGRTRAMDTFCAQTDQTAVATPERDDRFLTPKMLVERTRLAVRLIDAVEKLQRSPKNKKKVSDLVAIAEIMEVDIQKLRDLIAALFVVPEPSFNQLLELCQPESEERKKGAVELTDKYKLHDILFFSLSNRRLPNDEEARKLGAKNAQALKQRVQSSLTADLKTIADRFWEAGFNVNDVALNRYSFYYREYGVSIYQLWFGKNINSIFQSFPAPAQRTLKRSFERGESYLGRNPLRWGRVSNELMAKINKAENRTEVMRLIENDLGIKFSKSYQKLFNEEGTKEFLEFWNAFDIPATPLLKWFTYPPEKIEEIKERYTRLLELMNQWAFPLREQVKILQGKVRAELVEEKIAVFLDQGLAPEYFLPYVTEQRDAVTKAAHRVIGTVCNERRMLKTSERLEVPDQGVDMTYGTQDTVEALMYLDRIDFGYDTRVPIPKRRVYTPESLAARARILEGIPMPLKMNQLVQSPATLRRRLPLYKLGRSKSLNVEYEEGDYERIILERNLKPPIWLLNLVGKIRFAVRVRKIEEDGIPFTNENLRRHFVSWSWINLGPAELDRKITKIKHRMGRTDRWQNLCECYGIDPGHIPTALRKNKTPDHAWEYLMRLKKVDLAPDDIALSTIQTHSLPRFQDELAYRFRREKKDGAKLTRRQQFFLKQYTWADQARAKWGWSEAHDWCVLLTFKELKEATALVMGPQAKPNQKAVKEWREMLNERAEQHKTVIKYLRRTSDSFAASEIILDLFSIDELAELI